MELRHLESFVAVAEELHFSRAAERLQMAQSPLSQRIRALETDLGLRLFERTNRRVSLTAEGAAVLVQARRALAAAGDVRETARRTRGGETGTLRLGFVASAAFVQLPGLLRALHAAAPDVRVELSRLGSTAQADALAADRIDVGLTRTVPTADPPLGSLALTSDPLLAAVPSTHPLAAASSVGLDSLAAEAWVLARGSNGPSDLDRRILQACARAGFTPTVAHEAPDLPSVLGLVAGGLGVSLVPSGIARLHVPGVAALALDGPDRVALPSALVWNAAHAERPVVRRFVAIARTDGDSFRPPGRRRAA
ncbi:LysR substrate-binding domain-containing protein [Patulibacter americanus]|uniref:LysR substrate-binding domain-containing protein n=1 Tax=Patulibacter americanus TaxID=588672 RepID=UPI0003B4CE39|nr:LysR substrate-binding domain-containing protein [Patulibacter americanus]